VAEGTRPGAGNVLLVEDDPGDVLMIREGFEQAGASARLHVAGDGDQAMRFLRRAAGYADAPRPDLILLDLNLPVRSGLEVLAEVKTDVGLLTIPVVVVTTSRSQDDIWRSYTLHANAYVTKPPDFDAFVTAVRQIAGCFLDLIELPPWP
jgi:CheY-like chemotaxis protein